MSTVNIPYYKDVLKMDLAELNVAGVLEPHQEGSEETPSASQLVSIALEHPIGTTEGPRSIRTFISAPRRSLQQQNAPTPMSNHHGRVML